MSRQQHSALTISDENNNHEQSVCRVVVWLRKNYRKKSTEQITCTAVLPAPLMFCVKINRLPVGNRPENTVTAGTFQM